MLRGVSGIAAEPAQVPGIERLLTTHGSLERYLQCDSSRDLYPHMKNYFALYESDELCALALLSAPGEQDVTVTAVTHPGMRRRGLFSRLLAEISDYVLRFGYHSLLLVYRPDLSPSFKPQEAFPVTYAFSEYLLAMDLCDQAPATEPGTAVTVVPIGEEDFERTARMTARIFQEGLLSSASIVRATLRSPEREFLIASRDQAGGLSVPIGIAAISYERQPFIYSFGILPEYRQQGYGMGMFRAILQRLSGGSYERVSLEVNSMNTAALRLYRHSGMQIISQSDHYRLQQPERSDRCSQQH